MSNLIQILNLLFLLFQFYSCAVKVYKEMCDSDLLFSKDSLYLKGLVGKKMQIETKENKEFTGILYVVDPIYKTIILHTNWQSEKEYETTLILAHAIKSVSILSDDVVESYLSGAEEQEAEPDIGRKNSVKKWLEHMFINVNETGEYLKIDDHLVIVPPYKSENCICNNTIILEKIQKILELMPDSFP